MSIRLRLTLLYSAILALTLVAFSTALYATQTSATYAGIKSELVQQAEQYASPQGRPGPGEALGNGGGPRGGGPGAAGLPNGTLPGRWMQTLGMDGSVLGQTLDLNGATLPLSQAGLKSVQASKPWFEQVTVQSQPLLVYSQPYTDQNGARKIVQVAYPIAQPEQALATLRLILLAGSGLVIVAAFAIGWVLAGTALHPIERITHTAQAIGAERDFSRRVQHTGPKDEIGQLATTFNGMLAELESAYRQIQRALESQQRFVADASHELRTPLTTVRGNIELLQRVPPLDGQERAEIAADTAGEVDRLIRLVNQLLALARADAGLVLRREPVALKELLEDVCRQGKTLLPENTIQCQPSDEAQVLADRDALKQVLLILLDNALVHTAPGTPIGIETTLLDGRAVIRVRDEGPGIAPEALPHIFERFYRGDAARSGGGTGLGLAIARELVEAQGGSIAAESTPGQGSVFTVVLETPGHPTAADDNMPGSLGKPGNIIS